MLTLRILPVNHKNAKNNRFTGWNLYTIAGALPQVGILLRKITAHISPSNALVSSNKLYLFGFEKTQNKFEHPKLLGGVPPPNANL